jgi:hypothetical protein
MKVTITINLGNDAMRTNDEVGRALLKSFVAHGDSQELEFGDTGSVRDENGNRVGHWQVERQ